MKENNWQLLRYHFLCLVLLFMVALSFYGIFRKWESFLKNTCYKLFVIILVALLPSSCFNLQCYFRLFCQTIIIEMPSLFRREKLHVIIVVPKLQETLLYSKRRGVLLIHCIVTTFPILQKTPKCSDLSCSQETQFSKIINCMQV